MLGSVELCDQCFRPSVKFRIYIDRLYRYDTACCPQRRAVTNVQPIWLGIQNIGAPLSLILQQILIFRTAEKAKSLNRFHYTIPLSERALFHRLHPPNRIEFVLRFRHEVMLCFILGATGRKNGCSPRKLGGDNVATLRIRRVERGPKL